MTSKEVNNGALHEGAAGWLHRPETACASAQTRVIAAQPACGVPRQSSPAASQRDEHSLEPFRPPGAYGQEDSQQRAAVRAKARAPYEQCWFASSAPLLL